MLGTKRRREQALAETLAGLLAVQQELVGKLQELAMRQSVTEGAVAGLARSAQGHHGILLVMVRLLLAKGTTIEELDRAMTEPVQALDEALAAAAEAVSRRPGQAR